ncbi:Vacuolar protein-sorting-associated protein 60 [Sporothrix stenoceras]|uniref:Vacuolar protein-sorting-associated protein 60 n=1 Tax=Sporothrix stenoceras TaxID=5173 RepID=A0ABR3YXJ2_9PEZI
MQRLWGTGGSKAPKPSLNNAVTTSNDRIEALDSKIATLNAQLTALNSKMANMRDGSPGKTALRKRAIEVLKRRKQYESERTNYEAQVFNMERFQGMTDSMTNVRTTIAAMESASKDMKKQFGKVDLDKIERLQDEMADLMDVSNEIQETLGRSYDIPEDVDEAELDAELEALGADVELEAELGGAVGLPSFMQDEVPEFIDEAPQTDGKVKEVAG